MLAFRLLARAAAPLLVLAAVACQDPGDPKSGSTPTGTPPGTPTATGCPEGQQDNAGPGLCLPTCETSGVVCRANATCSDATGPAECFCDERFQDNDGDGDCSLDCASSPPCTANATCSDDSGEATCACVPRYQDHDGNGSCEPTCLLAALDCGHGACADASGTPTCACEPEYTGAGCELCASGFQDNDGDGVCVEDCATSGLGCGLNGACDDSAGEATCACDLGYAGAACDTCALGYQDDDGDGTCSADCATSGLDCGAHGACHTASGVAACACDALFTGATFDSCVPGYQDDDGDGVCEADCATAALGCGTHGACSTATGTAACACDFGWTGPTCTPIPSDGHFVDDDAAPGGDGNTWETAFTSVQDAILAPGWRYKVYVKEGT